MPIPVLVPVKSHWSNLLFIADVKDGLVVCEEDLKLRGSQEAPIILDTEEGSSCAGTTGTGRKGKKQQLMFILKLP